MASTITTTNSAPAANNDNSDKINNNNNNNNNNNSNCPWTIGQKIEACDPVGKWYPAKILAIKDFQILVHFQRWSSRYDQWFDMDSSLIRLTKESTKDNQNSVTYSLNEQVLARWTDGEFYPAEVWKIFNDNVNCLIKFSDGVKKKVKFNAIKKLPPDYKGDFLPEQPKSLSTLDPTNHNDFVCDICKKGFRKESLLMQHKKHYHNIIDTPSQQDGHQASSSATPSLAGKVHSPVIKTEAKDDIKIEIDNSTFKHKIVFKAENLSGDELKDGVSTDVDSNAESFPAVTAKRGKGKGKRSGGPGLSGKRGRISEANLGHSTPAKFNSSKYRSYYLPSDSKSANKNKGKPNLILPFIDAKQLAEEHENDNISEIVKCVCTNREENDLMVQCELCLCWQHALCMGFKSESDVPSDGYFCPFCRNPKKPRESKKNSYQLNHWLKNALAPSFSPSSFTPILTTTTTINAEQQRPIKEEPYMDSGFDNNLLLNAQHNSSLYNHNLFSNNANQGAITSSSSSTGHDTYSNPNDPIANLNSQYNKNKRQLLSMATSSAALTKPNTTFNNSNLQPSTGLFPSTLMEDSMAKGKKSFILHDFTNHSSNNCTDSNMADDHINNLIDISLKSDFFNGNKMIDEDEAFLSQVKATNMLSSALYDVFNNLHSLNYKIQNHRDVAYNQIVDKQKLLREHLELIESKIEKMEKEIELKESYAIQTSSSTLTAASPENYGINDLNGGGGSGSNNVINTSISNPLPLSSTNATTNKSFSSHLFDLNNTSASDHLALNCPTSFDNQSLSLNAVSSLPASSSSSSLDQTPISQHQNYYNIPQKMLTSSAATDNNNPTTVTTTDPSLASVGPKSTEPSNEANALARLYLSNLQNNNNNSNDEQELIENRRPTMSHEYLPVNLTDAELKMELSGHFKDLNAAKQLMFNLP